MRAAYAPAPQVTAQPAIVLCQRGNEAISAICAEPQRVAGKQILIVNEVDHMTPGMTGNKEAFDFDAVNVENLAVMQQHLFVVNGDLR